MTGQSEASQNLPGDGESRQLMITCDPIVRDEDLHLPTRVLETWMPEEPPDEAVIERWGYCSECGQVFPVGPTEIGLRPFASGPDAEEVCPVTGTRPEVYDLLLPGFLAHECGSVSCPAIKRG